MANKLIDWLIAQVSPKSASSAAMVAQCYCMSAVSMLWFLQKDRSDENIAFRVHINKQGETITRVPANCC